MEEQVQGGTQTTDGGADSVETKVEMETNGQKVINQKDHEKALNDMMKYKKELATAKVELEKAKQAQTDIDRKIMREKGLDKELAQRLEKELNEERETNKRLKESFITTHKFSALREAAIKLGIRPEAESDLEMLSLDDLPHELTSSGRVLVNGVDEYVNTVKKTKPHWFTDGVQVKFNPGGAGSKEAPTGDLDIKEIAKLKYSNPEKYKELQAAYVKKKTRS
jgi:hypothetical protein